MSIEIQAAVTQAALFSILNLRILPPYFQELNINQHREDELIYPRADMRMELLADLSHKEKQYLDEMEELIYPFENSKRDRVEIILFRLIAVNYLRNKILSGEKLSSVQIKKELVQHFSERMFESRGITQSHVTKVLKKLDAFPPSVEKKPEVNMQDKDH